jgi:hypothetical protein
LDQVVIDSQIHLELYQAGASLAGKDSIEASSTISIDRGSELVESWRLNDDRPPFTSSFRRRLAPK